MTANANGFLIRIGLAILLSAGAMPPGVLAGPGDADQDAGTTRVPYDFPVETLRGLVLADGDEGPLVVTGNDVYAAGVTLFEVNGQPVATARELLLAASLADAHAPTVSIVSRTTTTAAPAWTKEEWASGMLLSQTPHGVLIDYSVNPAEVGRYLLQINQQDIASVADARRLLAIVAASTDGYSIETSGGLDDSDPVASEGAPPTTLPAIPYGPPSTPPRHLMLDTAVAAEPPPPGPQQTRMFADSWGALARLAGKFYAGEMFPETCERGAGGNPCYALVWWDEPGRVLARYWYADLGYLAAADTILPTGRPGVFAVHRWIPQGNRTSGFGDVGQHYIRVSANRIAELGGHFEVTERAPMPGVPHDGPVVTQVSGQVDGRYKGMSSHSRARAIKLAGELVASIRRAREAEQENLRMQRRSDAMAGIYNAMLGVGHAIQADTQARQVALDRQLAAASAVPVPVGQDSGGNARGGGASGDSTSGLVPKTFRFFLWAEISANESDTRNPVCYSNVLVEQFQGDPHGWGDPGRKNEIFAKYRPAFEAKCARLGQLTDGPSYVEDNGSGNFGVHHPTDRRVTLP